MPERERHDVEQQQVARARRCRPAHRPGAPRRARPPGPDRDWSAARGRRTPRPTRRTSGIRVAPPTRTMPSISSRRDLRVADDRGAPLRSCDRRTAGRSPRARRARSARSIAVPPTVQLNSAAFRARAAPPSRRARASAARAPLARAGRQSRQRAPAPIARAPRRCRRRRAPSRRRSRRPRTRRSSCAGARCRRCRRRGRRRRTSPSLALSRPYAIAAAVGSLIRRSTSRPASSAGVLGRLALGVVEVRRHGDDRAVEIGVERVLGALAQRREDLGRDLDRRLDSGRRSQRAPCRLGSSTKS